MGATGTKHLVEFYRFLREANKIRKLENNVYRATEEEMIQLMSGDFFPKKVEKFKWSGFLFSTKNNCCKY